MSNLEWLLKNDKETVVELLAVHQSWGIKKNTNTVVKNCICFPCKECTFCDTDNCCAVDRENWLNAEHEEEPLLFPIGTPVEVPTFVDDTTELRYYWGTYHGLHFACKLKSTIGQTMKNGHPSCESFDPTTIRKVGDSNA